jgi:hypothetical protein
MLHKYPIGQLCVIVRSVEYPELIGRQCTVELQLTPCTAARIGTNHMHEYCLTVQGETMAVSCMEKNIRPVKPGDLPDFAEEETELDEEMPA